LQSKHHIADAVMEALAEARNSCDGRMTLVANLPYHVATPVLANLLLGDIRFNRFCFTVQREVGDRIMADVGSSDYGPLSILFQIRGRVERLALLKPDVFWPRPDVDSVMLRADVVDREDRAVDLQSLMSIVRGAFLHRRKTLKFGLSKVLNADAMSRAAEAIDLTRRPETVTVAEWIQLASLAE
jgi:16S rRNA (adenine1518-N6/adenine1519-N6)-dimethyltransferase